MVTYFISEYKHMNKKIGKYMYARIQNTAVVLNLFCQNTTISVTKYIPAATQHCVAFSAYLSSIMLKNF